MRKWIKGLCLMAIVFLVLVCPEKESALAANETVLNVGETTTCSWRNATYDNIQSVRWYSTDPSVARPGSSSGHSAVVQAVGSGTCKIKCEITSYCTVYDILLHEYVVQDYHTDIYEWTIRVNQMPTSVSLNTSSITMKTSDAGWQLRAVVSPANAVQTVTWSSSNSSVASVNSSSGWVTPHGPGSAVITATTSNGLTASANVSVKAVKLKSIRLNKSKLKLGVKHSKTLSCIITPRNAYGTVTWKSSRPEIAAVDFRGKVRGIKPGKADIVASFSNGKKAVCRVLVYRPDLKSVSLNKTSLSMIQDDKRTLKCKLSPAGAIGKVRWKSSRPKVAKVDSKGVVTAKSGGTTIIKAYVTSKIYAECKVSVRSKAASLKLSKERLTLPYGKQSRLTYTLLPKNAVGSVKWKSSNPKVASVDSSGNVKAKKTGTAYISATLTSKKVTKKCKVTVPVVTAKTVKLSAASVFIRKGQSMKVSASFTPSYMSDKVKWSSENPKIATVDSNGMVKALRAGRTTIKVSVSGKSASYPIEVMDCAWADIAKGGIEVFNGSYTQNGKSVTFSPDEPLTVVESSSTARNDIKLSSNSSHIILSGVHFGRIYSKDNIATIELKEGTKNYSGGIMIPKARLYICGGGYFSVRSDVGPAIGCEGMGARGLNIKSGILELHTGDRNSAVIDLCSNNKGGFKDIIIESDASVSASGGSKGLELERDEGGSAQTIAEGSFSWTP